VLGGLLIDQLSWRYVFFIAIPFAMVSIPLAMVFLPQREAHARTPSFDWTGVALLSVFLLSLLVALSDTPRDGFGDDRVALLFLIAAITGMAFIFWESKVKDPIFKLALFGHGRFFAAAVVTFVIGAGLFGSTYFLPLFLQTVQGLQPTDAGLLLLPAGLVMAVFFPLAGYLSDMMSPRRLILFGITLFAISSLLMIKVDTQTPFLDLALWTLLGRIGLSFIFPCLNAAAMRPLPLEMLAHGSGMINFLRQLGGAFGVNLLTIHFSQRSAFHAEQLSPTQTPGNPATRELIEQLIRMFRRPEGTAGQECELALHFLGRMVWEQANMLAYRDVFLAVGVVFVLCLIPAWFMDSRAPHAQRPPTRMPAR
jgi:EmrB/QacA subfamily drug resistance transporter